jgi:hypothetical protein
MSVPRCGSLAPVLTTLALPCLTYDNMILGLSLISSLVMKPDSLAKMENAMAGRQPDSHSNKEDAVAARARWTPDLHNSPLFVKLMVMKPDSRTNVEAAKVHCNQCDRHYTCMRIGLESAAALRVSVGASVRLARPCSEHSATATMLASSSLSDNARISAQAQLYINQ